MKVTVADPQVVCRRCGATRYLKEVTATVYLQAQTMLLDVEGHDVDGFRYEERLKAKKAEAVGGCARLYGICPGCYDWVLEAMAFQAVKGGDKE